MVCFYHIDLFSFIFFILILDSYLTTSQTIENLPELDLEAHYIDPVTSNDPEIQKVQSKLISFEYKSSIFLASSNVTRCRRSS